LEQEMTFSFPDLPSQDVFTLQVNRAGAWLWHPRLAPIGLSATRPEDATNLAHLILSAPKKPIVLVADDAAQEITLDTIPLLKGMDRRRLIVRRVQHHYPEQPFAACVASKRIANQERISILHLPHDGETAHWLHWLSAFPNPPGGTVATSKIIATILWRIAGNELAEWTHGFFLTESGLRQITLHEGQPVLSRLIPLAHQDAETLAQSLQESVRTAHLYLARHGWRENQPEQVIGIIPPRLLEATRPLLPPAMLLLNPMEAGRWLHCTTPTPDWLSLCAVVAQKYRRTLYPHFLPEERSALYHTRIAQMGWGAAASLLLFAGCLSAYHLLDMQTAQQQLANANTESASIQQAAVTSRAKMGDIAIARSRLRQARLLQQDMHAPTPWPLLTALSKAMPTPILVNSLRWEPQTDGSGTRTTVNLRILNADGSKDAAQQAALQHYAELTESLQQSLPHAQIKTLQVPYSLGAHQTFTDTAMLQTVPVGEATAAFEVRLP
jgi:hypothetical protein